MKITVDAISLSLSLLLAILFVCLIQASRIQEGMEEYNKVVLLGDSIFKNNSYVGEKHSIEYLLKNKMDSLVLAEDNSTIKDIIPQYNKMSNKDNEPNTYLFVSIGGNDLLNAYHYSNTDVDDLNKLDSIWNEYEEMVFQLISKTECTLVLTDLYYIKDKEYIKYHKLIKKWNEQLYEFCDANDILIYKISNYIKEKNHFVNSIEPSKNGSKIIVENIIKF